MTWSAPTALAAASTSALVASGRPKRMLSRIVPENRNLFCGSYHGGQSNGVMPFRVYGGQTRERPHSLTVPVVVQLLREGRVGPELQHQGWSLVRTLPFTAHIGFPIPRLLRSSWMRVAQAVPVCPSTATDAGS
jgi:hypothetical protein